MKNILMLNYEFPPLGGGAGNATYYLLKEFSKFKDIKINLVTASVNRYDEKQFAENIKIYYLDIGKNSNLHYQSNKDLLKYSWKAYFFSRRLLKKENYNLVHAFFGIPCGYIAMKLKLPYIVSLRGSDVPGHNFYFNKIYFLLGGTIKNIWKNANFIVTNSNDLKNTALKFKPDQNIEIINNGVDSYKFRPPEQKETSSIFRILYVGRLHKIKGVNYLIEAFKKFSDDKKNVELILVGEGPLYNVIKKINKNFNKIKITGRKKQDELIKIYQNSDVFVLPSLNEGMSNTVLEAMASGLPIIATDTGGMRELIYGENGFIVRKKNSHDIFQALMKLYNDNYLLKNMGFFSRKKAEKMSWKNIANRYSIIYNKCFIK